jgi:hypothetical protein
MERAPRHGVRASDLLIGVAALVPAIVKVGREVRSTVAEEHQDKT